MLAGFKANVSHQEIERILGEVEKWWEAANEQVGVEWLPLEALVNFLCQDLGYEDVDEFEDAIDGSFAEFLASFPHIDVKTVEERDFFKLRPIAPGPPRRLTLRIENSKQLLETTFMKAEDATVTFPCMEFEIGADNKRHIDSLHNHIAQARDALEAHAATEASSTDTQAAILETAASLRVLLDAEEPFDIVVVDPTGRSEFKPMDSVLVADM